MLTAEETKCSGGVISPELLCWRKLFALSSAINFGATICMRSVSFACAVQQVPTTLHEHQLCLQGIFLYSLLSLAVSRLTPRGYRRPACCQQTGKHQLLTIVAISACTARCISDRCKSLKAHSVLTFPETVLKDSSYLLSCKTASHLFMSLLFQSSTLRCRKYASKLESGCRDSLANSCLLP